MIVSVTQYKRPNGRPVNQETDLPDTCAADYKDMIAAGWRFAAEVVPGGVSLTIENNEMDCACELAKNGPEVQRTMAAMLSRRPWNDVNTPAEREEE